MKIHYIKFLALIAVALSFIACTVADKSYLEFENEQMNRNLIIGYGDGGYEATTSVVDTIESGALDNSNTILFNGIVLEQIYFYHFDGTKGIAAITEVQSDGENRRFHLEVYFPLLEELYLIFVHEFMHPPANLRVANTFSGDMGFVFRRIMFEKDLCISDNSWDTIMSFTGDRDRYTTIKAPYAVLIGMNDTLLYVNIVITDDDIEFLKFKFITTNLS